MNARMLREEDRRRLQSPLERRDVDSRGLRVALPEFVAGRIAGHPYDL